jgi:hypothetical protein
VQLTLRALGPGDAAKARYRGGTRQAGRQGAPVTRGCGRIDRAYRHRGHAARMCASRSSSSKRSSEDRRREAELFERIENVVDVGLRSSPRTPRRCRSRTRRPCEAPDAIVGMHFFIPAP